MVHSKIKTKNEILARKRGFLFSLLVSVGTASLLPIQTGLAGNHEHGPIYRTLDALAGGIEKVIDVAEAVKHRGSSRAQPLCDDGCDAMMMDELMTVPSHATPYANLPPGAIEFAAPAILPSVSPSRVAPDKLAPEPTNEQHSNRLTVPRMPSPPADMSQGKRPTPVPKPAAPATRGEDDEWIDSFSTETEHQPGPAVPRRNLQSQPKPKANPKASPGAVRSPAETYDSLPNPFLDDLQSKRVNKSVNQPASYWEPW